MREIKFRGKSVDDDTWIIGNLCSYNDGETYIEERIDEYCSFPVKSETVGQYTGLKDRNGKEIYDGDIVKIRHYTKSLEREEISTGAIKITPYAIMFNSPSYSNFLFYMLMPGCDMLDAVEVIGNIYENPELLEVKENLPLQMKNIEKTIKALKEIIKERN